MKQVCFTLYQGSSSEEQHQLITMVQDSENRGVELIIKVSVKYPVSSNAHK